MVHHPGKKPAIRQCKAVLCALFLCAFLFLSPAHAESPVPEQTEVSEVFEVMHAVGSAGNSGMAGSEALAQGCALWRQKAGTAVSALMAGYSSTSLDPATRFLYGKTQTLSQQALSAACAQLTAQGSAASGVSAGNMRDSAMGAGLNEGLSWLKGTGLPFTTRLEVETSVHDGSVLWSATTVQPLWASGDERTHLFTQLSYNKYRTETTMNW